MGISLLIAGRTQEAIAQFSWALRLNPNLGQAHLYLAMALASEGRSDEALHWTAELQRLEEEVKRDG